jgi:hypothetical protein
MNMRLLAAVAALSACVTLPAMPAQAENCGTVMSDSCLMTVLTDMGYAPKKLSKGYLLAIKHGTWTINMQVVLSGDGSKMGMNANLGQVPDPSSIPAEQWKQLLVSNGDIDPSAFYFDQDQKKLYLHRSTDNIGLTRQRLKHEIDTFADQVQSTADFWKFTK